MRNFRLRQCQRQRCYCNYYKNCHYHMFLLSLVVCCLLNRHNLGNAFLLSQSLPTTVETGGGSHFQPPQNLQILLRQGRRERSHLPNYYDQCFRLFFDEDSRICRRHVSSSFQLNAVPVAAAADTVTALSDYAPAATSLFNNMKLPAAVVTAGMISLGFATSFPELPPDDAIEGYDYMEEDDSNTTNNGFIGRYYSPQIRKRCESLRRLHIVVALISVTSELIVVLWSAVEVNQLTERIFEPTLSVWDLIQRDCDLAWSAVNSHFVLGIIGFCGMLSIRAYVMLLAAEASGSLISAAMTGTAAALCLMISVVNRGVEAGGGDGVGYGKTILDLLQHYVILLFQAAIDTQSPGPLELSAIVLEITSIGFALQVLLLGDDKESVIQDHRHQKQKQQEMIETTTANGILTPIQQENETTKAIGLFTPIVLEEKEDEQETVLPNVDGFESKRTKRKVVPQDDDSTANVF